jgi:hypothetical protein
MMTGQATLDVTECSQYAELCQCEPKRDFTRRAASSGMLRRVALVRTDVSEEPSTSFIRVTRIGELGTTLAVTVTSGQSSWLLTKGS